MAQLGDECVILCFEPVNRAHCAFCEGADIIK